MSDTFLPRAIPHAELPANLLELLAEAIAETHDYDDRLTKERSAPEPDAWVVTYLERALAEARERWRLLRAECGTRRVDPDAKQVVRRPRRREAGAVELVRAPRKSRAKAKA